MRAKTFRELRRKVHGQCLIDLGKRLKSSNPRLSSQEMALGTFLDNIEIQVRDAVLEMNRKGYCTWDSGFYGVKSHIQGIGGPFTLDHGTKIKIKKAGAKIRTEKLLGQNYTQITFNAATPDTDSIKRNWKRLISLIPDKGHKAILPTNLGSAIFWERYVPRRRLIRLRLQRLIGAKRNHRWMKQWHKQLKRLKK